MSYYETTTKVLVEKVIANLGKDVSYATIPTDGAQKAACVPYTRDALGLDTVLATPGDS
jgi:hypothetical protein